MPRPKKLDIDKADYQKNIRGTLSEIQLWQQAAKLSNMTFSSWARLTLTKCAVADALRDEVSKPLLAK